MKKCAKCGIEREETQFTTNNSTKDHLERRCKECSASYYLEHSELIKFRTRERNKSNKESRKKYNREYRENNRTRLIEKNRQYVIDNKEKIKVSCSEYYAQNKKRARDSQNKREAERTKIDPIFKLRKNLRCLIRNSLNARGYSKKSRASELVGIPFELLKNHLEYTWFQNYGTEYNGQPVHIDHIVPCSAAKTEEELISLQHWTNLQYLTPEDNLFKRARLPSPRTMIE